MAKSNQTNKLSEYKLLKYLLKFCRLKKCITSIKHAIDPLQMIMNQSLFWESFLKNQTKQLCGKRCQVFNIANKHLKNKDLRNLKQRKFISIFI